MIAEYQTSLEGTEKNRMKSGEVEFLMRRFAEGSDVYKFSEKVQRCRENIDDTAIIGDYWIMKNDQPALYVQIVSPYSVTADAFVEWNYDQKVYMALYELDLTSLFEQVKGVIENRAL